MQILWTYESFSMSELPPLPLQLCISVKSNLTIRFLTLFTSFSDMTSGLLKTSQQASLIYNNSVFENQIVTDFDLNMLKRYLKKETQLYLKNIHSFSLLSRVESYLTQTGEIGFRLHNNFIIYKS